MLEDRNEIIFDDLSFETMKQANCRALADDYREERIGTRGLTGLSVADCGASFGDSLNGWSK